MRKGRSKVPAELPDAISAQALAWLLSVSSVRLIQLAQEGTVERLEHGVYSIESVRNFVQRQREEGTGSSEWNSARTRLAEERCAAARMTRLEREGELLPRAVVGVVITAIFTMVREKLLALGTRVAAQCHLAGSVPAVQQIIDVHTREALEAVSESSESELMERIAAEAKHGRRRAS